MPAFNKTLLPHDQTGYFSNIVLDYLSGNEKLKEFYSTPPGLSSFKQAIQERQSINRELLVDVLKDQQSETSPPAYNSVRAGNQKPANGNVLYNINSLSNKNTFTVTTGHQPCLFTGPLYFIYKIISAINFAEELKKSYPTCNFVPVYWMASEDHDFDEINHIHLFGKTLRWDLADRDTAGRDLQSRPVGKISTTSLKPVLEELSTILGDSENAKKLIDLFARSYNPPPAGRDLQSRPVGDLSTSTRYLINELFGEYGLVVIDGDDERLKNEFKDIIQDDMINHTAFNLVNIADKKLSKHYKTQVNPREINVFYLKGNLRERIIKVNKELITELKTHPGRFSPNVVLRPLYQEKILPNLAMIGGGAELAYWLQLKSTFEHYKINFPVLVLRNSVMMIDNNMNSRLNKLGIKPEQLFNDTDRLVNDYLKRPSETRLSPHLGGAGGLDAEKKKITAIYKDIMLKAENTDASLKATVEAELRKQLNGLATIENKLLKAEKRKQETNVNQIKKIKEKLFPGNVLQERYDNFIPYYLKYGKEFITELKRDLNPLEFKFTILAED